MLGTPRVEATGKAVIPMSSISAKLLRWYDANRRELPWRVAPGEDVDPYRVWVSEIMLQQTQVNTVIPFYNAWIRKFPTLNDVANASDEEIFKSWEAPNSSTP